MVAQVVIPAGRTDVEEIFCKPDCRQVEEASRCAKSGCDVMRESACECLPVGALLDDSRGREKAMVVQISRYTGYAGGEVVPNCKLLACRM
jgi:hypothetical protein